MDFAFDKLSEGFFLAKDFEVGGVGFNFNQQFSFIAFTELVVEVHRDFLDEFLIVLISHGHTFFTGHL